MLDAISQFPSGGIEAASAELPSISARERELIKSVTGIEPDARFHIPIAETEALVRGVKDGDQAAMEMLISTRLSWIFKHFAQADEVKARHDIEIADVLQIGMMATILAAHAADLSSTRTVSEQIHHRTPRIMIEQLMHTKLLPTVKTNSTTTVYGSTSSLSRSLGRINDNMDIAPTEEIRAIEESDRTRIPASTQNDLAVAERSRHDGLSDELDARVRKAINSRHYRVLQLRGISCQLPEPYTLDAIGKIMGVSRTRVAEMESTALRKIRMMFLLTGAPEITEEDTSYFPHDPKPVVHPAYKREDLVLVSRRDRAASKAFDANSQRDKLLSMLKATPDPYTQEDHWEITHRERYFELVFEEAAVAVDQAYPSRS